MSGQTQEYNKSEEARNLFFTRHDGVLSTISTETAINGYPFGSVTPFCLDRQGRIVILISDLAQHTKNITKDNRVSMTIQADVDRNTDVQSHERLTYIGEAKSVPDDDLDEVKFRYIRYLPAAEKYFEAHSFRFYRIELRRARFIGGFGKIFWLEPEELLTNNPFDETAERSILDHMNEDHQPAMRTYLANAYDLDTGKDNTLHMVGVDAWGCDIRRDGHLYRIWFDQQVQTSKQAREQLVALAKSA